MNPPPQLDNYEILRHIEKSERAYTRGKHANNHLVIETQQEHARLDKRKHQFCPVRDPKRPSS